LDKKGIRNVPTFFREITYASSVANLTIQLIQPINVIFVT